MNRGMKVEVVGSKKHFEDPAQMIEVGNEYIRMKKYWKAIEIFEKAEVLEADFYHYWVTVCDELE